MPLCAHRNCTCEVEREGDFCSTWCGSVLATTTRVVCRCPHDCEHNPIAEAQRARAAGNEDQARRMFLDELIRMSEEMPGGYR